MGKNETDAKFDYKQKALYVGLFLLYYTIIYYSRGKGFYFMFPVLLRAVWLQLPVCQDCWPSPTARRGQLVRGL